MPKTKVVKSSRTRLPRRPAFSSNVPMVPNQEVLQLPEVAIQHELPEFENAKVLKVLEENVHGRFHHCKMSDGTTKHVPVRLFQ